MKVHKASDRRQANTRTLEVLGPMQLNERLEKPPLDVRGGAIGTYGLPQDQELYVGARAEGLTTQRFDEVFGQIPRDKLAQAEAVALVFRAKDDVTDPAALKEMVSRGDELEFCPCPN